MSHPTCKEGDSIVQIICKVVQNDLSLLSINQKSYALINPSDHNSNPKNYHSTNDFPTSVSYDSFFTSIDIYGLSYSYSYTCQAIEELQPCLMVMSGPLP